MTHWTWLDDRPIVVALAGPNGAGKTTYYHAHVAPSGLRFVNADVIARELALDAYTAAKIADQVRRELVGQAESFCFETVFSDPAGEKLGFLQNAVAAGYRVVLCYIGLAGTELSEARVAMWVSQGGHDVPTEKLLARYPRTLSNLRQAIMSLPHVLVFDNSDLRRPFRPLAIFEHGQSRCCVDDAPDWLPSIT